jgi:3-hydroxyacyl-CoA dehydrogenase
VIEAVVERMDVKQQVLRETESHVRAGCVLATNTSSLSVTEMQGRSSGPPTSPACTSSTPCTACRWWR